MLILNKFLEIGKLPKLKHGLQSPKLSQTVQWDLNVTNFLKTLGLELKANQKSFQTIFGSKIYLGRRKCKIFRGTSYPTN